MAISAILWIALTCLFDSSPQPGQGPLLDGTDPLFAHSKVTGNPGKSHAQRDSCARGQGTKRQPQIF